MTPVSHANGSVQALAPGIGLAPAFAAVRARVGLVALPFALAGAGWWWSAGQMKGMDKRPVERSGNAGLVPLRREGWPGAMLMGIKNGATPNMVQMGS